MQLAVGPDTTRQQELEANQETRTYIIAQKYPNTSSRKMVNENQEVSTVSSDFSKQDPTTSYTSRSIQPPRGQSHEAEKKISNSFDNFEVELDPFTTVVLSQL